MELAALRTYLSQYTGAEETFPFGEEALVLKVAGKMFALVAWQETPLRLTLKCEPERAEALREIYPAVMPGYYMNKKHWNTVTLDGSVPKAELLAMMDDSYNLVVSKLTKRQREVVQTPEAPS